MRSRPARESGFTLVEVLIALAIAGFLFTCAFWSLDQVILTRNALANQATPYTIGPAILDQISSDLSNAWFYDFKDNATFYGANAELNGREADAMSFLALSVTYAPEEFNGAEDQRDSHANEIAYVMRRGPAGSPYLQLWRREDFFVDDEPHAGGDYVPLYDRVHSLSIQYVSRNPMTESGVSGAQEKDAEDMLQDDWNSVKERGVPRAVQVTLRIYAQDSEQEIDAAVADETALVYTFQRFIALPQVHMALESEQQIAAWDGKFHEQVRPAGGASAAAAARGQTPLPAQPARTPGAGGARGRARGTAPAGANPFLDALRARGGGRPAGTAPGNLGALFGGAR